jgi:single-stranded DNA-binding protein
MAMHIYAQGNLARDPEFHPYGDNNTGVRARLVIASERERGRQDTPDYFDITVFGDGAEQLRTAVKGDPVAVSGEGRQRRWTDETGREQFSYQFVGHETIWHPRTPTAASRAANNVCGHADGAVASPAR